MAGQLLTARCGGDNGEDHGFVSSREFSVLAFFAQHYVHQTRYEVSECRCDHACAAKYMDYSDVNYIHGAVIVVGHYVWAGG